MRNEFLDGLKKGLPIGLGYFAVAFAFGISSVNEHHLAPLTTTIISLTNLSSAGQFAGVEMIAKTASYFELALAMLLINLRYLLMSISLTQKMDDKVKWWHKAIFGFGVTDETFAIAITENKKLQTSYFFGLVLLPYIGWGAGTAVGAFTTGFMPERIANSLGIALYAMFMAIIIPDARKSYKVALVILVAIALSVLFYYVPGIKDIGEGIKIVICTVVAALFGAIVFPISSAKKVDWESKNNV